MNTSPASARSNGASHNDTSDGYERIARFHLGSFAYLVKRLDEMPNGEGTVLDNSGLMFLSNLWSGTKHDNKRAPRPCWEARSKPAARWITPTTGRQSVDLQPIPVAEGPDGSKARSLRRCGDTLGPLISIAANIPKKTS
jgi:hypothetical protein